MRIRTMADVGLAAQLGGRQNQLLLSQRIGIVGDVEY